MKKFFKDFKEFATKGNVIDMAVGVVIGGSFSKIVTGLVNYIINPFIGLLTQNNGSLDSLKTAITPADEAAGVAEGAILWGTWLQTIIDFLITAFCIFDILRLIMTAKNTFEAKKIAEEKAAEEAKKAADEEAKKAAEKAAKAEKKRQKEIEDSLLRQEKLLEEILAAQKK
jgi:large conductance mechanosensitive channel